MCIFLVGGTFFSLSLFVLFYNLDSKLLKITIEWLSKSRPNLRSVGRVFENEM